MIDKKISHLPYGELEMTQAVWDCEGPASSGEIQERLGKKRRLAPTTVLTILTRLAQRGFLKVERRGKSNLYTPAVTREEYLASQGRRFFDGLCGGNVNVLASTLCSSGLTREEIEELRRLLQEDKL